MGYLAWFQEMGRYLTKKMHRNQIMIPIYKRFQEEVLKMMKTFKVLSLVSQGCFCLLYVFPHDGHTLCEHAVGRILCSKEVML